MAEGSTPRPAGAVAALLAAALAAAALGQYAFARGHAAVTGQYEDLVRGRALGLLGFAIAAVLMAALCRRTRGWPPVVPRRLAAAAVLLLVAVGGGLRFYRLHELPPGLWIDEALNGVQAIEIARAGWPRVALPPEDVRTGLGAGFVDVAALVYVFGDPDDGPWALRAVAAVLGTLGVAAAAALAWIWFGPLASLAATAWLTVSQWHLNYSRWGEMPIMSPLCETLVALGVTAGVRGRGWRANAGWLLAGAALGGGIYTYQTFRLWAPLALCLGAASAFRWRAALRGRWAGIAAGGGLAILVALPMLRYMVEQPTDFGERATGTLIFLRDDWRQQLAESVPRSLLAFQFVGDDNPRHNLPFAPLLGWGAAILAPLGLVTCAVRWREPACAATLLWFAAALVPAVITLEAPHATRLLDAIVPLALMVGVASDLGATVLRGVAPARAVRAAGLVALALAALAARDEWRTYFVERERLPQFVDAFFPRESAAARYLATRAPDATIYLDPDTYWHPALRFVARRYLDEPNDIRLLHVAHDVPPREPLARDALYLLPTPYVSFAAVLHALSDETRCEEVRDRFGRVELAACRVPRDAINRAVARAAPPPIGLAGQVWDDAEQRTPPRAAPLPFTYVAYSLEAPPLGHFALGEWWGTLDAPRDGEYLFRLHPDSTTLTIDDHIVLADAGEQAFGGSHDGRIALTAGPHRVRITLRPGARGFYFLWFYWQPPGAPGGWVPASALRPPTDDEDHLAPSPPPG
ncbi:hypothetical protein KF840_14135 [bacterium]|nr:hypothetical protein [bacterium]